MTETSHPGTTRASYDTVAADDDRLLGNGLDEQPFDRAMLGVFAERVPAGGGGPVGDLGAVRGGQLLPAFEVGDGCAHLKHAYGHDLSLDVYGFRPERVSELLGQAGFVEVARLVRAAEERENTPQTYLLALRRVQRLRPPTRSAPP